jgi:predicted nuclease of predicted toxin-antitoxin system
MKFLIDMNLTPRWAVFLQSQRFEAVHWSELGSPGATDEEIMAWAAHHNLIVLTHDLDFSAILAANKRQKPSVVQIRSRIPTPESVGSRVISALRHVEVELDTGALLTIEPDRARLRLLPLQNN